MTEPSRSIFREKTLDHISSPEQLDDYLHVTTPGIWLVLAAVILLAVGLFAWSGVTAMESYAAGTAEVANGNLVMVFDDAEKGAQVTPGMEVSVGQRTAPVQTVGRQEDGTVLAVAEIDLPDGQYDARVSYERVQIIEMLFH